MNELKINNSKEAAVKGGKWSNPGAKLYDTLLDSFYCDGNIPTDSRKLNKMTKEGKVFYWDKFLQEAYLVAPVNHIKNSPYSRTTYSNSGCKYPHHVVKGNELVLSVKGVMAAYSRAKQMDVYKGKIKEHLERHMKELEIEIDDKKICESIIYDNFNDIYDYLNESLDINLYDESASRFVLDKKDIKFKILDIHDPEASSYIKKDDYLKIQKLNNFNGEIIIDEDNNDIIGRFLIGTGNDEGFISSLKVYDKYKGYGFGNKLIDDAINKYNGIDLIVFKNNKVAIRLYKKYGFVIIDNPNIRKNEYYMKLKNALSKDELTKVLNKASTVFEYLNELNTPNEIFEWIKSNVSYDKVLADWKLKTPLEVCTLKKGNCHDQSLLSYTLFSQLNILTGQIFFIEYKEGETVGGNTHTFTWYIDNGKYYWFENAWEDQAGIHGPFKSINDMKDYVRKVWNEENDLQTNHDIHWDGIIFSDIGNYKPGMNLGEYVDSWMSNKSIDNIQESLEWIDEFVHNDEFRDSINIKETNMDLTDINDGFKLIMEDVDDEAPLLENNTKIEDETKKDDNPKKEESKPKQIDKAESSKNGIRRKKLYIAFIEWAKSINEKNMFGSIFDKDAFKITYPFVPEEMRYFYRLANPILCVLTGNLTFFQVSELKHLNIKNSKMNEMLIFAATETDFRVFNNKDKKVYRAVDKNGDITLMEPLGSTFDTYIQNMIKKGDILNGPITESFEYMDDLEVSRLYEESKSEQFKSYHENIFIND